MHFKKWAFAVAGCLFALSMLGCGGGGEESPESSEPSPGVAQQSINVGETRWRTIGCCITGSKQLKEEYTRSGVWRPAVPVQYRCYGRCAF